MKKQYVNQELANLIKNMQNKKWPGGNNTETEEMLRDYFVDLYANKFEQLHKMDHFLEWNSQTKSTLGTENRLVSKGKKWKC